MVIIVFIILVISGNFGVLVILFFMVMILFQKMLVLVFLEKLGSFMEGMVWKFKNFVFNWFYWFLGIKEGNCLVRFVKIDGCKFFRVVGLRNFRFEIIGFLKGNFVSILAVIDLQNFLMDVKNLFNVDGGILLVWFIMQVLVVILMVMMLL